VSGLDLPIRRPVATGMVFTGIVLLGLLAWVRIPVELFPNLSGDELSVFFSRPGGEPEVVEREILIPLESRVKRLAGVSETWGEVTGSAGSFRVRFERGVDLKIRELELQRMAAELARTQPRGSVLEVRALDTSVLSRFVMVVHVTGGDDPYAVHDLVEERIAPLLAAVPGVSRALTGGAAARQVNVSVDADRIAALGITPDQVRSAVLRSVGRLRFVGDVDDEGGRTAIMLDGRPGGVASLARARVQQGQPALLGHVAEVAMGPARERTLFRVDGAPSVGVVVFQHEDANLVRLGRALRREIEGIREEFRPLGLDLAIGFDGAQVVEDQIDRLLRLAATGFAIGLVVLYLFLRQWRAVLVVGIAVPVSLLGALTLLHAGGQTLNLISLFGLAVGVGLLVDNSVVVYEAVQRRLERGASAGEAAVLGVRRTVRAIVAASLTTAIVFLPAVLADFEQAIVRSLLEVIALAILLPLAASLCVAVGLVPLLAHRLAAPAAIARLREGARRRERRGGLTPPDRGRALFSGLVVSALRHPAGMLATVAFAVVLTALVALPWVAVSSASQEASEADQVRLSVRLPAGSSLAASTAAFEHLEQALLAQESVARVESFVEEEGGSLTIDLVDEAERAPDASAGRVRQVARSAARELSGVEVLLPGESEGGDEGGEQSFLGQGPAEVVVSGPDNARLRELAEEIRARLESIPEISRAWLSSRPGRDELWVTPDPVALASYGLTSDQVLPALVAVGREGEELRTGMTLSTGRELPIVLQRARTEESLAQAFARMRLATPAGLIPFANLAPSRRMPPRPTIQHHDGRRELSVYYRLGERIPETGPGRIDLDERIARTVRELHRPAGYVVELDTGEEQTGWFKSLAGLAVLLLFLVLAMTFESTTLPFLVLISLPLTLLGATWALVLAGMALGPMVLVGVLALIGLTVNPAILLVDRMQQRVRSGGASAGAAALAAVRERARPVLMTTATTVAGLWPLALVTGQENEIWPPFATVVMGGLVTSTLLTLLVIPVGFVLMRRLDDLFGRLGPWVMIGWIGTTAAVMVPLIRTGMLTSLTWQVVTTLLVAGLLLGTAVFAIWRPAVPEPAAEGGPPALDVRCLRKVYGLPGPVGRAWRLPARFAHEVRERGGVAFEPADARERLPALLLLTGGSGYLAVNLQSLLWRVAFLLVAAGFASKLTLELRRARGKADALGDVAPGGPEGALALAMPWLALAWFTYDAHVAPRLAGATPSLGLFPLGCVVALTALAQAGRRTAEQLAAGRIPERATAGGLRHLRSRWRKLARRLFGLDLPREQVVALRGASFRVERGMVGVLGPNGAGKTTLLRQLAGVLEPDRGRVAIGGVHLGRLRRYLARWVGYLPQDAALPPDLTAREYLEYYALLYEIPAGERRERIDALLEAVGLGGRADERIGDFSGGMRQRVAVARTLLRLPAVIIVDEPTVGLDPRERLRFRNLLAELARGRVVLFSTHVVEDVAVACERVLVLARGRLLFDGKTADLNRTAEGRVWQLDVASGSDPALSESARIASRSAHDGREQLRILSAAPPHPEARAAEPTLEEAYLALIGEGRA
jgi:multidrug efflux pump subunit AcrB/ABC-type multidrug transport system ATPase subunit